MDKITLLSYKQIFGEDKLNIFNKIDCSATITDFAILLGVCTNSFLGKENLKNRTGYYWMKSYSIATSISYDGNIYREYDFRHRNTGIRPVVSYTKIKNDISNEIINEDGIKEIEYGEYPQYAVSKELQEKLENLYENNELTKTGKKYTTDSRKYNEDGKDFLPHEHIEYEFDDKKYVRVKANSYYAGESSIWKYKLSNGEMCRDDDYVWVEVSRVKWLVDEENDIALSKNILVAGIQFDNKDEYDGDFENTNIYKYLNTYFIKDIQTQEKDIDLSKVTGTYEEAMALIEEAKRKTRNILDKSIVGRSYIKKL